jgi:hypothetical protein
MEGGGEGHPNIAKVQNESFFPIGPVPQCRCDDKELISDEA